MGKFMVRDYKSRVLWCLHSLHVPVVGLYLVILELNLILECRLSGNVVCFSVIASEFVNIRLLIGSDRLGWVEASVS